MNKRRVLVCDKLTMEVVKTYESMSRAAAREGRDASNFYWTLTKKRVGPGRFVYRYEEDYDPEETFEGRRHRPVLLFDKSTGQKAVFFDKKKLADSIFSSAKTIDLALKDGHLIAGRFALRYAR